jgi:hypothetical protein
MLGQCKSKNVAGTNELADLEDDLASANSRDEMFVPIVIAEMENARHRAAVTFAEGTHDAARVLNPRLAALAAPIAARRSLLPS